MTSNFARAGACLFLLAAIVAGCASPGTPKPPSLHLPRIVSDLTAERVGDTVRLHWTTPSKTTDGIDAPTNMTAQICRKTVRAAVCSPVRRLAVKPGATEAVDALPAALAQGPGTVLAYEVEILNGSERSAGFSPPALAAGGAAPPQVDKLTGEASREGALLRWRPEDAADAIELKRLRMSRLAKTEKRAGPGQPDGKEPIEVRLRAVAEGMSDKPFLADAGGTVDATAAWGEGYTYTARRVRRVVLDGHAFELRSAASLPVTVIMRDTFPPRAPVGLEAIAVRTGNAMAIDLSWTPNTEEDLVGYLVYRRDGPAAADAQITASMIVQPAYRDTSVQEGRAYSYTVLAVDRAGNRSTPSASAQETATTP